MCGQNIQCPHCFKSTMVPLAGINPDSQIGEYTMVKRLGMGSMGEVWLAQDALRNKDIALKILAPALTKDDTFVKRFQREVSIAAKMSHPNVVTAFDAGVDRNIHYLAINYVNGKNLARIIKEEGCLEEREALDIAIAISSALKYAHEQHSIVHRDIKPSNIMIDKTGVPLLMDLGVSKQTLSRKASLTAVGQFVGTPHYMSPEQARAEPSTDFKSDIYSLGCTIYHMLAGRPPFSADSNVEILNKHIHEYPEPVHCFNPNISEQCEALLEIMLAKNKSDRQDSWLDVIQDLQTVKQGDFPYNSCKLNSEFYDRHSHASQGKATHNSSGSNHPTAPNSEQESKDFFEQKVAYFLMGILFSIFLLICVWILTHIFQ